MTTATLAISLTVTVIGYLANCIPIALTGLAFYLAGAAWYYSRNLYCVQEDEIGTTK